MVKIKKMTCGIRIVMEKISYVQSASVGIWVKAGSANETDQNNGISHYIEHMLFKGTDLRTAKQIAEDMDKIGGNINAFTGKEATCYYVKALDTNFKKACEILLDMFLNSKFDLDEMEREKKVVLEEMKMSEDQPDDLVHDLFSELVFQGTDLERQIIGTKESLSRITREDILAYIKEEYTRDNLVISLAGNFDEDEMCAYFEGRLSGLKAEKKKRKEKERIYSPKYVTRKKEVEQAHICMGVPGICLADDEFYYPLALLNNIMGGSMSSRLFQSIREQKGLAYSVYSSSTPYSVAGAYYIYAGVNGDKTEDAIQAIAEELKKLKESGITGEELSMTVEQIKSSYIFGLENVNNRMFSNGKNVLLLDEVRTPEQVIAEVNAVTLQEIQKAIDLISDVKSYSVAVVGNKAINLEKIMGEL